MLHTFTAHAFYRTYTASSVRNSHVVFLLFCFLVQKNNTSEATLLTTLIACILVFWTEELLKSRLLNVSICENLCLLNRHWGIISAYGRCVVSCSIQIVWCVHVEDYTVKTSVKTVLMSVVYQVLFCFFFKNWSGLENCLVCCQLWGLGNCISGVFHETKKQKKKQNRRWRKQLAKLRIT